MSIDREIAEKVMGWEFIEKYSLFITKKDSTLADTVLLSEWWPSTSINHAMKVVEEMNKQGFACNMWISIGGVRGCRFGNGEGKNASSDFGTFPEAICKAALEALK